MKYVGYVKDASSAVASFKKVHAQCSAAYLKKRKKGTKAAVPPPTSKAAQELLSIGNSLQFNVTGHMAHVSSLAGPCERVLPAKTFQDIAKIKGVSSHFKWLTKQLEGDKNQDDCYLSPFPSKPSKELNKFLLKHLPDFRPPLPGSAESLALRDSRMEVAAMGLTNKHVYHGTTSYGMNQVHLLIKGEYIVFGCDADFLTGTNIKNKIDGLQTGVSGSQLKAAVKEKQPPVWFFRHQTPGTVLSIPIGHVFVMIGNHDNEKVDTCCSLRWNYIDISDSKQVRGCCNVLADVMKGYTEMNDADHKAWLDFVKAQPAATAAQ